MVTDLADVATVLALSDERDQWLRRVLDAERAGYERGFNDGRATACTELAVMEEHREKRRRWNEYAAKIARVISSNDHPGARRRQLEAEIAADEKFMAEAAHLRRTAPWKLSPTQYAVVHRARFERLDESEVA